MVRESRHRLNPPRRRTLQQKRLSHSQSPGLRESLPQRPRLRHADAQLLHQPRRQKPLRIPPGRTRKSQDPPLRNHRETKRKFLKISRSKIRQEGNEEGFRQEVNEIQQKIFRNVTISLRK